MARLAVLGLMLIGCGWRTGLEPRALEPAARMDGGLADAHPDDARIDAPADASRDAAVAPDAGADAGTPLPGATGVWVGPIPNGDNARVFTVVLRERADSSLLGYVAGGTAHRTIGGAPSGSAIGEAVLTFTAEDPGLTFDVQLAGVFDAESFRGIAAETGAEVVWHRRREPLFERRFVFWPDDATTDQGVDIAVVLEDTPEAALVSGGYVGRSTCRFACAGGALGFVERTTPAGYELGIELESGGVTGTRSTLDATMALSDPAHQYRGAWTLTDPDGATRTIAVRGVRTTATRTDDVESMLATLDALAFGIETDGPVDWPLALDFRHDGRDRAAVVRALEGERARYAVRRAALAQIREAVSESDPLTPPRWREPFGLRFHDLRTGTVAGRVVTYRDVDTDEDDTLRFLEARGDRLLFVGNRR